METTTGEVSIVKGVELTTFIANVFDRKDVQKDGERLALVIPVDSSAQFNDSPIHRSLQKASPEIHYRMSNTGMSSMGQLIGRIYHMSNYSVEMLNSGSYVYHPGSIDLLVNNVKEQHKVLDENMVDGLMSVVISQFDREGDVYNVDIIADSIAEGLRNMNNVNIKNNLGFTGVVIPICTTREPGMEEFEEILSRGISKGVKTFLEELDENTNTIKQIKQIVHSERPRDNFFREQTTDRGKKILALLGRLFRKIF